jgi:ABC-type sugar transport system ATPase subunit
MSEPFLRVTGLSKSYSGVQALAGVDLDLDPGEIRGLCGENGAGKSTLIKILAGSLLPDAGRILVAGTPLPPGSVRASEHAGIAVIHQESVSFPHLSAQDNIFVGREPRRWAGLALDRRAMLAQTQSLLARLGETIDPWCPVGELPLAQRQMVAMARALSHRCRLLVLDEPTASLSQREAATLFRVIRQLQADGVSILYVSHRLEEIFQLADRVTVLRDGQLVATRPTREISRGELIRLMVGRELLQAEDALQAHGPSAGDTILAVNGLARAGAFRNITFSLRQGEILGMAGLVGAGRSEIARALFGVDPVDAGVVTVAGQPLPSGSVAAAMAAGLALVPEDRQQLGLVLPMSVSANLSLAVLRTLTRLGLVSPARENALARRLADDLHVKAPAPWAPARTLSGGNQQKLVLGKWLAAKPRVLLLDEPTRGVDVGAKAEIYRLIRALAAQGLAILLISSDLPEVLLLSDRILVLRSGEISGELPHAGATQEKILALAMPEGAHP